MKSSLQFLSVTNRKLMTPMLVLCLVLASSSFMTLPVRAGDDEADAQKAFDDWVAANEAVAQAKKDLKKAIEKRDNLLKAITDSGGKSSDSLDKQLEDARQDVAKDEALLEAAEAALLAARLKLEEAIAGLPEDSKVKQELKRKRDRYLEMYKAQASVASANGLLIVNLDTKNGRVTVNLPEDLAAGDTISGTVFTEPKGNTPEEKAKNQDQLNGYVIDLEGTKIKANEPRFTWIPQTPLPAQPVRYQLKIVEVIAGQESLGTTVGQAFITPLPQFVPPTHPSGAVITPGPQTTPRMQPAGGPTTADPKLTQSSGAVMNPDPKTTQPFSVPLLGQQGRPSEIIGPFDGDSSNTSLSFVRVGSSEQARGLTILAESPRRAVFVAPSDVDGALEIQVKEGAAQTNSQYRNLGVQLSAPKTNLLRGEKTTLTIQVQGLEGIKEPVPLTLNSGGVITMEGGNYQPLTIQPSQVSADGRYSTSRAITGIQAGAWTATATVETHAFDVCLQDDNKAGTAILINSFTGAYVFFCPGCAAPGQSSGLTGESAIDSYWNNRCHDIWYGFGFKQFASPVTGNVTMNGCKMTLRHNAADRSVVATIDKCANSGNASIEIPASKLKFTITDRNTVDNTCPAH